MALVHILFSVILIGVTDCSPLTRKVRRRDLASLLPDNSFSTSNDLEGINDQYYGGVDYPEWYQSYTEWYQNQNYPAWYPEYPEWYQNQNYRELYQSYPEWYQSYPEWYQSIPEWYQGHTDGDHYWPFPDDQMHPYFDPGDYTGKDYDGLDPQWDPSSQNGEDILPSSPEESEISKEAAIEEILKTLSDSLDLTLDDTLDNRITKNKLSKIICHLQNPEDIISRSDSNVDTFDMNIFRTDYLLSLKYPITKRTTELRDTIKLLQELTDHASQTAAVDNSNFYHDNDYSQEDVNASLSAIEKVVSSIVTNWESLVGISKCNPENDDEYTSP